MQARHAPAIGRGWHWAGAALVAAAISAASWPASAQRDECPAPSIAAADQLRAAVDGLLRDGRPVDALPQARCLVRIASTVFGPAHATTRNLQKQLLGLLRDAGRREEAEALANEIARSSTPKLDDSDIDLLIVEEKALIQRGDYDGSMRLCLELRDRLEARGQQRTGNYATMLNECGRNLEHAGADKEAEQAYRDSAALARELEGPRHPLVSVALNNLGIMLSRTGRPDEAIPVLDEALRIEDPRNPDRATVMVNLGITYRRLGRFDDARTAYLGARDVEIQAYGPRYSELAFVYDALAGLAWVRENMSEALDWQLKSNEISEGTLRNVIGLGNESQKLSFMETLATQTDASITMSQVATGELRPRATALGLEAVLQRKGRLLDDLTDSFDRLRRALSPDDRSLFERWRAAAAQYSTLVFRGAGTGGADAHRKLVEQSKAEADALEAQLGVRSGDFRERREPVTVAAVQRAMPPDAVLIEWVLFSPFEPRGQHWGAPRYMAYVLERDGAPEAVDVGEAAPLESSLFELLVSLRERKDEELVRRLSSELETQLLSRVRPLLRPGRKVLISPDALLNLLPFGVLLGPDGHYLVQEHELTYLTSGRDLLRSPGVSARGPRMRLIADPDFGEGAQFEALPWTAREATALKASLRLRDDEVLTRANATEASIKQLHGPRVLHIATHGFFLTDQVLAAPAVDTRGLSRSLENPLLRSGLALAGANGRRSGNDDGLLTALEVAGLDLTGTELAVLSACDTGVGQLQTGEGVYGLRRALVLAGVRTQVASLWRVDDQATSDLMVDYYARLKKGVGRSQALRDAQLAMLEDRSGTHAHPAFWAPFVSIGDSGPLRWEEQSPPR
jgi:CHAT domain-containing protein/tetratricopeptide (TPR) repeat protein